MYSDIPAQFGAKMISTLVGSQSVRWVGVGVLALAPIISQNVQQMSKLLQCALDTSWDAGQITRSN